MEPNEKIAKWESQVRKGFLDMVILLCLENDRHYGYELMQSLKRIAGLDISEGTIYPLLNRLAREDLITSEWVGMPTGMPRKYYRLTDNGRQTLTGMRRAWIRFSRSIDTLLEQS